MKSIEKKIASEIWQTTDYSKFKFYEDNRDPRSVARIKKSIKKIGCMYGVPVLVTPDFHILDGQNRFLACKNLQIPVYYTIQKLEGVSYKKYIIKLQIHKVWKLNEYIRHYAMRNIQYHSTVNEFAQKYGFNTSNNIKICTANKNKKGTGPQNFQQIKEGVDLPLEPKRDLIAEYILRFKELYFYSSTKFVICMKSFYLNKNVTKKELETLYNRRMTLSEQASLSEYIKMFENVINKGRKEEERISL